MLNRGTCNFRSFPTVRMHEGSLLLRIEQLPVSRSQPFMIYPGPEQSDSELGARRLGGQLGKFLTASLFNWKGRLERRCVTHIQPVQAP